MIRFRFYSVLATLIALAAVFLIARSIDFYAVLNILGRAKPQWVVFSALIPITLGMGFSSARLRGILTAMERTSLVPLTAIMRMSIVATAVNNLSMAPAGEAVRCVALSRRGLAVKSCVSAQLFEKVIEISGLGLLSALMCIFSSVPALIRPPIETFVIVAGLLAIGVRLLQAISYPVQRGVPPPSQSFRHRISQPVINCLASIADNCRCVGTTRIWGSAIFWSMLADGTNALSAAASLMALGIDPSPALCFSAVLGVRASALVPSIPGRIGVQEAGMVMALVAFDVPQHMALAAAMLYHACNLLPMIATAGLISSNSLISNPAQ
jgi:uncharacterized protein (TIRG00374 family)